MEEDHELYGEKLQKRLQASSFALKCAEQIFYSATNDIKTQNGHFRLCRVNISFSICFFKDWLFSDVIVSCTFASTLITGPFFHDRLTIWQKILILNTRTRTKAKAKSTNQTQTHERLFWVDADWNHSLRHEAGWNVKPAFRSCDWGSDMFSRSPLCLV